MFGFGIGAEFNSVSESSSGLDLNLGLCMTLGLILGLEQEYPATLIIDTLACHLLLQVV